MSAATGQPRVSTGYAKLDKALNGGFLLGSAIILCASASDEAYQLMGRFLGEAHGNALLVSRTSSPDLILSQEFARPKVLTYDESLPESATVIRGKNLGNLTEANLEILDVVKAIKPSRVVLEILSEVLLRHGRLLTRKWLSQFLARLRSRGITTLALFNPYMHPKEDVEVILDLFDGNLKVTEQKSTGATRKYIRIEWMHGVVLAEKEVPLFDTITELGKTPALEITVPSIIPSEPRWKTSLINRREEISKLKRAFDRVLGNRACVVALRGEAGVGKTRLMHELAAYAQNQGATVLYGTAMQSALPYANWVAVTKQYLASVPREVLRLRIGTNTYGIAKLLPDIEHELAFDSPTSLLSGEEDRIRFYEAVSQFFASICDEKPLVMLFDDMQDADKASLDLLEYFVRSRSSIPVLAVCSSRPLTDEDSSLEQIFLKLDQERILETVTVTNFGEEETLELTKEILGEQNISLDFSDLLYQRTGGNPFFIEEIIRALVEDSTIFRTAKGWDHKPIREITMPPTVKSVLQVRLSKLDADTISLLQWAAVAGVQFDFEVLREASGVSDDDALRSFEVAMKRGLFVEVSEKTNRFRFTDQRIRELLLASLIQLKQRRYHHKIAEAVEKIYANNLDVQAELIATHYFEAQNDDRAVKYFIIAGNRNRSIHAYPQAINDYVRVLELTQKGSDEQQAAILEKLAATYGLSGEFQRSVEFYSRTVAVLEKLHDLDSCARLTPDRCWAVRRAKGVAEALQTARDSLKYVEGFPESFNAATVYANLGLWLNNADKLEESISWTGRAREVAEKTGNAAALSDALFLMGVNLADTGQLDEGLSLLKKGLAIAQERGSYHQATERDLLNLAFYTYPRNLTEARQFASELVELGKRENYLYDQATGLATLSVLDWISGNWSLAVEECCRAFEIQNRLGFDLSFNVEAWAGRLYLGLGDLAEAEKFLQAAITKKSPEVAFEVEANLALGLFSMEQARVNDAKAYFETCVDAFKGAEFFSMPLLYIETLVQLTSIHANLGSLDEAARLSGWAKRLAESVGSSAGLAMAWQAEAILLRTGGDVKRSREAYARSLHLWEEAGWPYYKAKLLVAYSEAINQTDQQQCRKLLQQASEIFRCLGAKIDLEKTTEKLNF